MKHLRDLSLLCSALLFCGSLAACGDDDTKEEENPTEGTPDVEDEGSGTVELSISGGDALASGIDATEDGWSITFHSFIVTVQDATIAYSYTEDGEELSMEARPMLTPGVLDLATADTPFVLGTSEIPLGSIDTLSFTNNNVGEHHRALNIDSALRDQLEAAGVSGRVVGELRKEDARVAFTFDFNATTFYENCALDLLNGEHEEVQIAVDPAQLFRTSLSSSDGPLRVQALADAAVDGQLTNAELDGVLLDTLADYDAGAADESLYDFIQEQFSQIASIDGGGLCD